MRNIFNGGMGSITSPNFDVSNLHTNLGLAGHAILSIAMAKFALKKVLEIVNAPELGKRNLYRDIRFKNITKSKYKKVLTPKFKVTKKMRKKGLRAKNRLKQMGLI